MSAVAHTARSLSLWGAMLVVAVVAMRLGVRFGEASTKQQIIMVAGLGGGVVLLASGRVLPLLLFGWVMLLTYNRQYYSFDGILGDYGSQGLYWIPADAALVCMLAVWAYEAVTQRQSIHPMRKPVPWYVPFLVAAGLSALVGEHLAWGASEWLRWVKLAVIVAFLSHHVRGRLWWVCIGALGVAAVVQSGLGFTQVAMNTSTGLFSMLTGGGTASETLVQSFGGSARTRASGTLAHPNILGPFLLFLAPAFLALAIGGRDWRVRVPAAVACLASYAGLAATMSRLPIALSLLEAALTLVVLLGMRLVSLRQVLALAAFAGTGAVILLMVLLEPIMERFSGDLKASFEFREQYNDVALAMWQNNPLLGVGLNHFPEHLSEHSAKLGQLVDEMGEGRKKFGLRVSAPVHNLYLLVMSETGTVGLVAFLVLLFGALYTGICASVRTSGAVQLAAIGLTVGLVGQYLQQLMDFSLWMDPGLVTFSLVFCLLTAALDGAAPEDPFAPAVVDEGGSRG